VCLNAQAPVVIVGQEFVDSVGVCHGRWGFESSYKACSDKAEVIMQACSDEAE